MDLATLIDSYGYPALFIGTFLEGETILLLAGLASHRGYMSLPVVMATACCASVLGDQLYFWIGRRYGSALASRFTWLEQGAARVRHLLHRFHTPLILSIRFLYGLRIAGPIALGMTREIPWRRYLILNLIGGVIWAIAIAGLGFVFGSALELVLADLRRYELWAFAGLLLMAGLVGLVLHRRRRSGSKA